MVVTIGAWLVLNMVLLSPYCLVLCSMGVEFEIIINSKSAAVEGLLGHDHQLRSGLEGCIPTLAERE